MLIRHNRNNYEPGAERGAAAVEAALVLPLLLLLFFGILEFGLLFRANHSIADASRSGARVASAMPRQDGYQTLTADAVAVALRGEMPSDQIDRLTIYKADPATGGPASGTVTTCTVDCYRFDWDAVNDLWIHDTGSAWPAANQAACGDRDSTDYIGVWVEGRYEFATGFFGADRTLTDKTVMRLEPLPLSSQCEPNP